MSDAGDERMEPGTVADTDDGHCLHLKRIADVLTDPHGVGGYIEDIAFNAGRAFENGRRQG